MELPTKGERQQWLIDAECNGIYRSDNEVKILRLLALTDYLDSLLADSRQCTAQAMKRITDMEARIEKAKAVGHDVDCASRYRDVCTCPMRHVIAALEGKP